MRIKSKGFENGALIPPKYTCDGENISPALVFEEIPENTQSLALIMEDPDVPKSIREDGMWDHWVVFNMPPDTKEIKEGIMAPGVTGLSTRQVNEYGGPCPPDREHRYFFKLFALDTKLDLGKNTTKKQLIEAMEDHILAEAELMGRYERR